MTIRLSLNAKKRHDDLMASISNKDKAQTDLEKVAATLFSEKGCIPRWIGAFEVIRSARLLDHYIRNFKDVYRPGCRNDWAVNMAICWYTLFGSITDPGEYMWIPNDLASVLESAGASNWALEDLNERWETISDYIDRWFINSHCPLIEYGFKNACPSFCQGCVDEFYKRQVTLPTYTCDYIEVTDMSFDLVV